LTQGRHTTTLVKLATKIPKGTFSVAGCGFR
jgi:hypothetical protein